MRKLVPMWLAVLVTPSTLVMVSPGQAGAMGSPLAPFTITTPAFSLRTQTALPSGNATAVYTADGVTLTVAAPTGSAYSPSLDPYDGPLHFGVSWSGCNHKHDGVAPVDLVHSPPSAGAAIIVDIKLVWSGWLSSCT